MADLRPGKLLIGGEWRDALSGETFPTVNPATGAVLTQIAKAGAEDVDLAVRAARRAFEEGPWPKMSAAERGRLVWKLGDLLFARLAEVAELETLDVGKPINESKKIEIPMVGEIFHYYAGWTTKITGQTLPSRGPFFTYTVREPVGVVGAIVPWNFPLLLASWKVAPALAMGCTVVLKPASESPLTALKLGELALEAGVPPGVLNVVTGGGSTAGMALVRHPGVDKIAFTGSTETGKLLAREAAGTVKRLTLELGGKSPNIVFADADLEAATRGAMNGIFYNKGEVCAAGSRLFVEDRAYGELVERLRGKAESLAQGDPLDPKTRLGPQVSQVQMEKILGYCDTGRREGARVVTGGERNRAAGPGYYVKPTVFAEVTNDMTIAREEIFGPVVAALRFRDVEEAVRLANETSYGLAAGVWTRDVARAHQVVRRLRAGTVWVNTYNVYDPAAPFGGFKESGFGRELGEAALEHYTEHKTVCVSLG
jgi:aldehyde dehydrogenase (NAD+)